jgi:hypothetical protein
MSRESNKPSEGRPEVAKSTRRDVLKRLVIGLGAAALIQPNGGVFAQEPNDKKKKKKRAGKKKKKKTA